MNTELIIYILFCVVIIIDIYFYLENIFNSPDSKFFKKKINKNIIEDSNYKYFKSDTLTLLDVPNINKIAIKDEYLNLNITQINIERKVECDLFEIGENVNNIIKLDLHANYVISHSKDITVENDLILDKFHNVICIFKDKSKEELIDIAKNYSIRRDALRYFTNAKYYQFSEYKKLFDIRYSKPYYDKLETLWAIVPNKVNEREIGSISINFNIVDDIYIFKNVERVIIEKKSEFNNLFIDKTNNYLAVYHNSLVYKKNQMFVSDGLNTFNKVGFNNQKDIKSDYKVLSRKYINTYKIKEYVVANDLQIE